MKYSLITSKYVHSHEALERSTLGPSALLADASPPSLIAQSQPQTQVLAARMSPRLAVSPCKRAWIAHNPSTHLRSPAPLQLRMCPVSPTTEPPPSGPEEVSEEENEAHKMPIRAQKSHCLEPVTPLRHFTSPKNAPCSADLLTQDVEETHPGKMQPMRSKLYPLDPHAVN